MTSSLGLFLICGATAVLPLCPAEQEIRSILGTPDASWSVECAAQSGNELLLAAIKPSTSLRAAPRLEVAVKRGATTLRAGIELGGSEAALITAIDPEEWLLSLSVQPMGSARWIKVEAIGRRGEDNFSATGVISFFIVDGAKLKHIWTGLGNAAETRMDMCQLFTDATFKLLPGRILERTRTSKSTLFDPSDIDPDTAKQIAKNCVAPPPRQDRFPLAKQ